MQEAVLMCARQVLYRAVALNYLLQFPLFKKDQYIRTLLRTLQAGFENINPLFKNPSRLPKKNPGSLMRVSFMRIGECEI